MRAPRPTVRGTVVRLAAVALLCAVLIWSVMFADLLRKRADTAFALNPPAATATPGAAPSAPAPVTTRTS
jgi:hypothetical protein